MRSSGTSTIRRVSSWLAVSSFAISLCATARADDYVIGSQKFTVPPGCVIEQVAGPPLVDRPIHADFDEQGFLYVVESSGSNDNVQKQLKEKPHRVLRLEDSDGDGRFDRRTVFADRMMFPEGAMWYDGSLYVAAPPSIWKLTDTDGDGVADQRVEWFEGKTLNGCANDLHGPYLGPDGWIYWCKGAFERQTYERPGRSPLVTRAAHIFRQLPGGSTIEPVMTGGMDNPVELIFTPAGDRIFNTTFLQHPRDGKRDGLIHAIYGGVYGKIHDVINGHPRTGDVMPPLVHLGAAAPAGLTRLESTHFGNEFENNVLCCLFNMRKLTRHVLSDSGASYSAVTSDFVSCDDLDFHPTDALEDADGSIIVIDTGGWYKLCCPTSQLWKPDVLGAIYRVRRKDSVPVSDPRGLKLNWTDVSVSELATRILDARPAVRKRAQLGLSRSHDDTVQELVRIAATLSAPQHRARVVWALTRIHKPEARTAVRNLLSDSSDLVRRVALHSISAHRDHKAEALLIPLLNNDNAHVKRLAAEALGRIGSRRAVHALIKAASRADDQPLDRSLEHAITFALIEIDDAKSTRQGLASSNPGQFRAATIALDQMEHGQLTAKDIAGNIGSTSAIASDTAWWVLDRHPDWADSAVAFLRQQLLEPSRRICSLDTLSDRIARFAGRPAIQQLISDAMRSDSTDAATRQSVLLAISKSGLKAPPMPWQAGLESALSDPVDTTVAQAVATVHSFSPGSLSDSIRNRLSQVAGNVTLGPQLRLQALAALPKARALEPNVFSFLKSHVDNNHPVPVRALATDVLTENKLASDQLVSLTDVLPNTGPMELKRLVKVFDGQSDPNVGRRLVAALVESPAAAALQTDALGQQLEKFGPEVESSATALISKLERETKDRRAKLEAILPLIKDGDVRRGQRVFHGTKTACISCHQMGYLGGRIGPDLNRIGGIRSDRDLLESILFPSLSFVRSYEPTQILTTAGQAYNGIVRDETDTEVVLVIDAQKELRIPHDEIDERQAGNVSIMPAGLDKQLTDQQLADLVAFLKAAR